MEFREFNDSIVNKLRVKGAALDYVSTKLNFERLLTSSDFSPSGLPLNAICCIRKITDPQPGILRLENFRLRFAESWQNAVVREVENQFRHAFRPIRELVPSNAECVVFTDQAELLSCLAIDFCRGAILQNWWWRAIFPQIEKAQTVARIWIESIEFAPAAFQLLSRKKEAVKFVNKMQPAEIRQILLKIFEKFSLNGLDRMLNRPSINQSNNFNDNKTELIERNLAEFLTQPSKIFKIGEIISRILPEINDETLNFEALILLESVLLLIRSPKIVCSSEFVEFVQFQGLKKEFGQKIVEEILERKIIVNYTETKESSIENRRLKNKQVSSAKTNNKKFKEAGEISRRKIKIEKKDKINETLSKPEKRSVRSINFDTSQKSELELFETPTVKNARKNANETEILRTKRDGGIFKIPKAAEINSFEKFFVNDEEIEYGFQTNFGGVFYLLNLGLYLELYRDFTLNLNEELNLSIWDFVALISLEFLGEEIKQDAVWEFMKFSAQCATDEDFGRDFEDSKDWRVPKKWLKNFGNDGKWLHFQKNKRLIVRHSAGFNVLDISIEKNYEKFLEKELSFYKGCFNEIKNDEDEITTSKNWIKNLAEYLEKRLFLALNVDKKEEINAILFKRKASVLMTSTQLDITFPLADLPLEVRMAGIDRDPGWIPSAGRFIKFYFI